MSARLVTLLAIALLVSAAQRTSAQDDDGLPGPIRRRGERSPPATQPTATRPAEADAQVAVLGYEEYDDGKGGPNDPAGAGGPRGPDGRGTGIVPKLDKEVTKPLGALGGDDGTGGARGGTNAASEDPSRGVAELRVEVKPVLTRTPQGAWQVRLQPREQSWGIRGKMKPQSAAECNQDRSNVLSKLQSWTTTLDKAQSDELARRGSLAVPVAEPFAGLRRLRGSLTVTVRAAGAVVTRGSAPGARSDDAP